MAKQEIDPIASALAAANAATDPNVQKALLEYLSSATRVLKSQEQREQEERAELERQLKAKMVAQANNARIAEEARIEQEKRQNLCSHMTERGSTLIGGQRIGGGKVAFRCADCGKQFTSWHEIPTLLKPNPNRVGGPTSY
jgi:hypothetical protein